MNLGMRFYLLIAIFLAFDTLEDGLYDAIRKNKLEMAEGLLQQGAHPNGVTSQKKLSPLFACKTIEALLLLERYGGDLNLRDSLLGDCLLHRYSPHGDSTIVNYLLLKGVPINARNRTGSTPLLDCVELSVFRGETFLNRLNALIHAGADVHAVDASGQGALHKAARANNITAVQAVYALGVEPSNEDSSHMTPLVKAMYSHAQPDVIDYLSAITNINDTSRSLLPINLAIGMRDTSSIMILLNHGASIWLRKSGQPNAVEYAEKNGKGDLVPILLP
jgi:ankyrin repeat protein